MNFKSTFGLAAVELLLAKKGVATYSVMVVFFPIINTTFKAGLEENEFGGDQLGNIL